MKTTVFQTMKKNTFEKNQGEAISSLIKIWDLFEIFDIAK